MFDELLEKQSRVISRRQAIAAGLTSAQIRAHVESGRWQRLFIGVYATFSGPVSRAARLAAVALYAGDDGALSHQTAAELAGLVDEPSAPIHVTLPTRRRLQPIAGVVLHRSCRIAEAVHPSHWPPRTRIDETIIDLIQTSPTLVCALGWITRGCGRRLTTPARLREAIARPKKLRWRAQLTGVVADVEVGCHSVLEWRYLRDVERAHGLPTGRRQAIVFRGRSKHYDDVRYDDYHTVVELDGLVAHPPESVGRDRRRDNTTVEHGARVVRYGWADVVPDPCSAAAQMARMLQAAGWRGAPRPCGRSRCVINELYRGRRHRTPRSSKGGRPNDDHGVSWHGSNHGTP